MTPKVSVVIPVYNVEQYLQQCLNSILNQTLKEIEVICVDDGSTDGSLKILKEYEKKDNRITVMTQKNLYSGVARNVGLAMARGKYVHFMDADDWVEPDVLEQLVDIMDAKHPDFIKFKNYNYDCNKQQDVPDSWISISFLPQDMFNKILGDKDKVLLTELPDSPWSGLYDTKFLKDNSIKFDSLKCCNDVSFFIHALVAAKKIYVSDKTYVHYRTNRPGSLIVNRVNNFNCQTKLFFNAKKILKKTDNKLRNKILAYLVDAVAYRFKNYTESDIDLSLKQNLFKQVFVFFKHIPNEVIAMCKSTEIIHDIQTINGVNKSLAKTPKHRLFYKERRDNGERRIYIFGIRVLSYKKGKFKYALAYPVRVYEKYHRLKDKIREIKRSK